MKGKRINALLSGKQDFQVQKTENEDLVTMPMSFARELIKQTIYNPDKSSTKERTTYSLYTRESIEGWLQNPGNNEKNLRAASNYLYLSSMHYQRLIEYYAGIPLWAYVLSPLGFDQSKTKAEAYKKQYLKVSQAVELMNIPETMKNIATTVLRDGIFYGIRVGDKSSSFIMKVNPDYCALTSISDGVFFYSIDMSQFNEDKLSTYPEVLTTMYKAYQSTKIKYQEVPAEYSVCIKADPTTINYSLPVFAAVLPSLYKIANVESLQETGEELNNYKMISGRVPVSENGEPTIPWDLVMKYYNHISNSLGDNIGLAVSPFDLKAFNFESSGSLADVDILNRTISNYWSSAGTSGLLHGVANSTAGVTKLAIKNDESFIFKIVKQIERWFNLYLKTCFIGTVKFKITFLPLTIFNKEEYISMYKESVPFGIGKTYYMAALGIPQTDIEGLTYLENEVLEYDKKLKPLLNSHNASSEELSGQAGREAEKDEDLSESGESTRDNDTNENR